jgi:hypothetical protein
MPDCSEINLQPDISKGIPLPLNLSTVDHAEILAAGVKGGNITAGPYNGAVTSGLPQICSSSINFFSVD